MIKVIMRETNNVKLVSNNEAHFLIEHKLAIKYPEMEEEKMIDGAKNKMMTPKTKKNKGGYEIK